MQARIAGISLVNDLAGTILGAIGGPNAMIAVTEIKQIAGDG